MASLQQESTGTFHVVLRIDGKRYKRSLGTKSEGKAQSKKEEVEEKVGLLKRGIITVPDGADAIDFVLGTKRDKKKHTHVQNERLRWPRLHGRAFP